jgi:hypothetical protein
MRQRNPNKLPIDQRLVFTIDHAKDALDCGRSKVYELIRKGVLELTDIDGMKRITGESLRRAAGIKQQNV